MKKLMLTTSLTLAALAGCSDRETPAAPAATQSAATQPAATQPAATATGTVESIDAAGGRIVISHGPVPALEWPPMTMGFRATAGQAASVQVGQQVEFDFTMRDAEATLTRIQAVTAPAAPTPPGR